MGTSSELKSFMKTHMYTAKSRIIQAEGRLGVCLPPTLLWGPAVTPGFGGEAGRVHPGLKSTHQHDGVFVP